MRKFVLVFLTLFSALISLAQVKFEASAPLSVSVGDRFRVEFVLTNGEGTNFAQPSFSGAEVLAGPSVATGTHTLVVNGKQSSQAIQTFTFIMQAQSAGSVKVGAATILAGGKSYTTKPLVIEVVGKAAQQNGTSGNAAQTIASDDVLLRVELNKTNVYKGEAIVATLKFYSRIPISGVDNVKYAAFNGFWTQELNIVDQQPMRATVNGKAYTGQVVRQWLIFPQKSGVLEIEQNEFTVVAQITVPGGAGGGSLLEEFFGDMGGRTEFVKRKVLSPTVKINVKELPKPEPSDFNGAVGRFNMEASISGNSFPANSSGNITLKISGSGNFPLITTPEIVLPAAFEKYDVKINDQVKYSTEGASGSKSYEFPFITRAEGEYEIAPIEFSYFDVASKSYKRLSSGDFKVAITKGDGSASTAGAFISGVTKEDLKMLGSDIRFIKVGNPELKSKDDKFLWSGLFFILLAIIIALFVGAMMVLRKLVERRGDVVRIKNKKANKVAIRRLKISHAYMVTNNKDRFYEEMLRALWGYIGDKLAIEVADLTKDRVNEQLLQRGVAQEQADQFLKLIADCELAQYSPSDNLDMLNMYNNALDIIGNMEVK